MKPPIIVDESGDTSIFKTVEGAESYLESPDVLEGRYVAYDSEGRLLALIVQKPKNMFSFLGIQVVPVQKVTLQETEREPLHANELKEILSKLLKYYGVSKDWLCHASLNNLLLKSIELIGFTR